jgi:hypothetical protein
MGCNGGRGGARQDSGSGSAETMLSTSSTCAVKGLSSQKENDHFRVEVLFGTHDKNRSTRVGCKAATPATRTCIGIASTLQMMLG